MLKRLFTVCLTAMMLLSTMASVFATRKSDEFANNTSNIYSQWGDFETKEQFAQAHTINDKEVAAKDKTILTGVFSIFFKTVSVRSPFPKAPAPPAPAVPPTRPSRR